MMPLPTKDGSVIGIITQVDLPNMVGTLYHLFTVVSAKNLCSPVPVRGRACSAP